MCLRRSIVLAFVLLLFAAVPAHAQQMLVRTGSAYDRVRVSGFVWRAKVEGTIGIDQLAGIPGFEQGIDVVDTLGLSEAANGWFLEANVAAGKRHRFVIATSKVEHRAAALVPVELGGGGLPSFELVVDTDTTLSLRDVHGFYNFLFVARPQVEAGLLIGGAYFDALAEVDSSFGFARAGLDTPFPIAGANLMINPQGPVRGYVELSGFPKVEVNDLSGWQADFTARLEVFIARYFGAVIGYRRYRFEFDQASELGIDLGWSGLTFGGQVRY